jgi:hypothetical protein
MKNEDDDDFVAVKKVLVHLKKVLPVVTPPPFSQIMLFRSCACLGVNFVAKSIMNFG